MFTVTSLTAESSLLDLQKIVKEKTGIPCTHQKCKVLPLSPKTYYVYRPSWLEDGNGFRCLLLFVLVVGVYRGVITGLFLF